MSIIFWSQRHVHLCDFVINISYQMYKNLLYKKASRVHIVCARTIAGNKLSLVSTVFAKIQMKIHGVAAVVSISKDIKYQRFCRSLFSWIDSTVMRKYFLIQNQKWMDQHMIIVMCKTNSFGPIKFRYSYPYPYQLASYAEVISCNREKRQVFAHLLIEIRLCPVQSN